MWRYSSLKVVALFCDGAKLCVIVVGFLCNQQHSCSAGRISSKHSIKKSTNPVNITHILKSSYFLTLWFYYKYCFSWSVVLLDQSVGAINFIIDVQYFTIYRNWKLRSIKRTTYKIYNCALHTFSKGSV